jgi:uncharacterized membrane protein YfcA
VPAYALFVIALAAVELRRRGAPASAPRAPLAWLLAAGVAHGLFAASGPLVVYALSRALPEKRGFRATLAALWLVLNLALVAGYVARGALTADTLRASALMLAPMALGLLAGDALHRRLDGARFRTAVFGTMLAGGLTLLASGW